jgi:hypothetical protein
VGQEVLELKEIKEPKLIAFKEGIVVQGLLIAIDRPEINGKKVPRFIVQDGALADGKYVADPEGERSCFLATYQLAQAISMGHIGCFIAVRCEGEDRSIVRNGNAMKKFRVWATEKVPKAPGGAVATELGITDEDIPF